MNLKAGLIGLPNVGKSSLFSALTKMNVEIANYPFATIEPNIATVEIHDPRILQLTKIVKPEKTVFATYSFVDIAGLIKGASTGEGLGNKFLANVRNVDCLVHIVRCFQDPKIIHVNNEINPIFDIQTINLELIFADLGTIQTIISRLAKKANNTNDKQVKFEFELAKKVEIHLKNGKSLRDLELDSTEILQIKSWQLLTIKPVLYVANLDQKSIQNPDANPYFWKLKSYLVKEKAILLPLCIALEQEISQLDEDEKHLFLKEFLLEKSSLDLLILHSFYLLDLATFFTVGKKEVRSWTFRKNTPAIECSGIIHSDFKKKFIRVEIISFDDFVQAGSEKVVKENGKMRLEGKDYLIKDGEICHFRIGN
ncbi:redox-regulated ATPase YchF [Mesomycoplasma hyopneumoniae]|uniref:Ribosome-binding ATPase YchF n=1 Tax=Mesomycoplasma hyopneumoniae (strain 7448) TaxID=262722 RepID=Q4A873_MESH7|nr:redox-regulated ATPase YchF [Mesomycoplasma hyopneumoniae]AAZ53666.1 GTP-binding protein YchF [Mesomycoplasma hyopneumoniae 7448]MXR33913.1 redox-regulated ATPase YchF [Mesomycoplasma hyopneumoniae]